jgi:NTE family protein
VAVSGAPATQETPGPLRPSQIRYLSFEGGGGRGFAYLGALEALEQLGVLRSTSDPTTANIVGFGGSSAGAITALLLSCGYSPTEVRRFMESTSFDRFFDRATPRVIPGPFDRSPDARHPWRCVERSTEVVFADPYRQLLLLAHHAARFILDDAPLPRRIRDIATDLPAWLAFLNEDMGLFSGCFARNVFADVVAAKLPRQNGSPQYHATFADHFRHFGTRLIVLGTNLETLRSQVFSVDRTPDFPVADAIRISMSIPLIFKPVVIPNGYLKGTWVDGGLLSNLPLSEFEQIADGFASPKTLALRLDITQDERVEVNSLLDVLTRMLALAVGGAGEAHVREDVLPQTILLDTTGLDLVDFEPSPAAVEEATRRSRESVERYFRGESGG